MKVQGNRYITNQEMITNKVEKKTTVPQNIISEDDVKISDSARKLVETARDKVSDFQAMHFSSHFSGCGICVEISRFSWRSGAGWRARSLPVRHSPPSPLPWS